MEINAVISNQYTSSQTRATWPRIVDYEKLVRTQELLDQISGEDWINYLRRRTVHRQLISRDVICRFRKKTIYLKLMSGTVTCPCKSTIEDTISANKPTRSWNGMNVEKMKEDKMTSGSPELHGFAPGGGGGGWEEGVRHWQSHLLPGFLLLLFDLLFLLYCWSLTPSSRQQGPRFPYCCYCRFFVLLLLLLPRKQGQALSDQFLTSFQNIMLLLWTSL